MNETNWISLSERKPTEEDADDYGYVWELCDGKAYRTSFECAEGYWAPIPKSPPLPKAPEKSQRDLDEEKLKELLKRRDVNFTDCLLDAMQWARTEERVKFAAQCLGMCKLDQVANVLEDRDYIETPKALRALHKLLTEAAEKS